jgi:hypothetical protein
MDGEYKLLTIQRNYPTPGYSGTSSNQTFVSVYGLVQTGAGREFFAAKQRHSELNKLLRLEQYISGVDETMTVLIDGIRHGIIAIDGVREENWMELKLKLVK